MAGRPRRNRNTRRSWSWPSCRWLTLTAFTDTYRPHRTERFNFLARGLTRTLLTWALITITAVFSLKFEYVSRQFIAYFVGASAVFIVVRQLGTTVFLRNLRRSAHRWRTAVVIGDDEAACEHFAGLLTATYPMGYQEVVVQPIRRMANHHGNGTGRGNGHGNGKAMARGDQLDAASFAQFDDVYLIGVNDGADSPARAESVLALLKKGKSVHIIPSLLDTRLFRQSLGDVAGIPVLSVSKGELNPLQSAVKRCFDFVLSSVLLVVLSPLIGAVALAVKWTSSGSALFRQKRLGLNGEPFTLYKFRTMRDDAEQVLKNSPALYEKYLQNNFKLPKGEDPRLTPLGKFLRATSLDELPQLFNVLIGEMSLVGPRPIVPHEAEQYGDSGDALHVGQTGDDWALASKRPAARSPSTESASSLTSNTFAISRSARTSRYCCEPFPRYCAAKARTSGSSRNDTMAAFLPGRQCGRSCKRDA